MTAEPDESNDAEIDRWHDCFLQCVIFGDVIYG